MKNSLALWSVMALSLASMRDIESLNSLSFSSPDKTYKNIRHRRGRKKRGRA